MAMQQSMSHQGFAPGMMPQQQQGGYGGPPPQQGYLMGQRQMSGGGYGPQMTPRAQFAVPGAGSGMGQVQGPGSPGMGGAMGGQGEEGK